MLASAEELCGIKYCLSGASWSSAAVSQVSLSFDTLNCFSDSDSVFKACFSFSISSLDTATTKKKSVIIVTNTSHLE